MHKHTPKPKWWWFIGGLLGIIAAVVGYFYIVSPAAVRAPKFEHAHMRMQLIVNGQVVNFGDPKYQAEKGAAACNEDIAQFPIHFHDNLDQFVHLHWKNMTGGLILKNYGWNFIGGTADVLGYRFDQLPKIVPVTTYGNVLPAYPDGAKLWVFTGNEQNFVIREATDFLTQDIETFLGKQSLINPEQAWFDTLFFTKVSAHAGHAHEETEGQKLERINNLLGNVVIFVQKERPTEDEAHARFQQLVPLTDSTCGG